jgi:hypothetical protein
MTQMDTKIKPDYFYVATKLFRIVITIVIGFLAAPQFGLNPFVLVLPALLIGGIGIAGWVTGMYVITLKESSITISNGWSTQTYTYQDISKVEYGLTSNIRSNTVIRTTDGKVYRIANRIYEREDIKAILATLSAKKEDAILDEGALGYRDTNVVKLAKVYSTQILKNGVILLLCFLAVAGAFKLMEAYYG